ncbi:2Fe-2S iron-sulfur cluster-binding protein [Aestuariirhabdus litorea]|uniref:CDP-6-deoxy-delta-3,4-glucoseen reductase n=1 Tax=Aestuariirhabdus litorea TaxID=2528527 RepID=A0A3P3VJS3_9GAMM|nr:2Fe-2S iron-sulfur cluster-binding protein [Aestuariirhabdus litorea]RRJ82965.1 CDP-6-deoxy-delta-3,4-glucoseen reductase [Aestuariirhabdus litorea]RWW93126.1 2Fe-2S iron-sulfur cluster binding domain-containing protein [Endozoicomonadaceae bacterium GTF-13]
MSYRLSIAPSSESILLDDALSLLENLRQQGYQLPSSCRNGNCYICETTLLRGEVESRQGQRSSASEGPQIIYSCISYPRSDLEIAAPGLRRPGESSMTPLACQVQSIDRLSHNVYRVLLKAPAGNLPVFHAGQYLMLELEDGQQCPFSIASAPERLSHQREIELHIQHAPGSEVSDRILQKVQHNPVVRVLLPQGNCHLQAIPPTPLVFLAAGTGFAQMKGMIEHCLEQQHLLPLHLYWGVRKVEHLYMAELPYRWSQQSQQHRVTFHPVISDEVDADWEGRCGALHHAVVEDLQQLGDAHFYICGSPQMVYASFDDLVEAGVEPSRIHSDVFDYAPRQG